MGQIEQIGIADLVLDGHNPRHLPVDSTRACIAKLLEDQPNKLIELAKDVAEKGQLNPSDLPIVVDEDGSKVVLEGNRRVAVVKLLQRPDLAPQEHVKRFAEIARSAGSIPTKINCLVMTDRDEARPWLKVRHMGENRGRGIVPWSPEQQQRFDMKPNSQAGIAVQLLDGIEALYGERANLIALAEEFRRARSLTTLGRLMQDPYVRERLGLSFGDDGLQANYNSDATSRVLNRILSDFSGADRMKARDINTKIERMGYIDSLGKDILPSASERMAMPISSKTAASSGLLLGKSKVSNSGNETLTPIRHVFDGLKLQHSSAKARVLLKETKTFRIDKYVVTSSVLLRVLLEVVVGEANDIGQWKKSKIYPQLEEAFKRIDPNREKIHNLRKKELDDAHRLIEPGGSFSLDSLHQFVHDWSSNPTENEVRTHSAALVPFLNYLDAYIGDQKRA
jgi:hypothetical protein